MSEIKSTVGRMPVITFSDDADYDALLTVIQTHLGWVVWQVLFRDYHREPLIGRVVGLAAVPADVIGVTLVDESGKDGDTVSVRLDDVAGFVYL